MEEIYKLPKDEIGSWIMGNDYCFDLTNVLSNIEEIKADKQLSPIFTNDGAFKAVGIKSTADVNSIKEDFSILILKNPYVKELNRMYSLRIINLNAAKSSEGMPVNVKNIILGDSIL